MSHINKIIDADPHFTIDPISRRIRNESSKKVNLIQGDHNSERFSFELPRFVEGHDMLECNRVEVHFINIENNTGNRHEDMYDVKDMQIHPNNPEHVAFSWLITDNATKYVGSLAFGIRFCCTDKDNVADYVWKTAVNKDIKISEGMNTAESVDEAIPDIIAQWEDKVLNGYVDNYTFKKSYDNDSLKEIIENEISKVPNGKTGITKLEEVYGATWGYLFDVGTFQMLVCRDDLADGGKIYTKNMVFDDSGFEWSEWEELTASSGGDITVDSVLDENSENPVQNKVINYAIAYINAYINAIIYGYGPGNEDYDIPAISVYMAEHDAMSNVIHETYATKEEVTTQIGDIETSLENIIDKYGLGGEAV